MGGRLSVTPLHQVEHLNYRGRSDRFNEMEMKSRLQRREAIMNTSHFMSKEVLSYGLIATRDPTFRVDDLIELHHSGGKERLTPL